jgi:MT0933-like antitoxin protein
MSMPGIDVTEIVRSTAGKYLGGDVSKLSKEELVSKVKTMAAKDPAKADQMISEVGENIDMKTGGKFAGKIDQVQDVVKKQLGI